MKRPVEINAVKVTFINELFKVVPECWKCLYGCISAELSGPLLPLLHPEPLVLQQYLTEQALEHLAAGL